MAERRGGIGHQKTDLAHRIAMESPEIPILPIKLLYKFKKKQTQDPDIL